MGPESFAKRTSVDLLYGSIGFLFGAWLVGFRNLNPRSIQWLSADARLAQLGYEFFWRSPWMQFPLDATPNFGERWGVGLNQNAYNSLLALILKPIAVFFPTGFQFQGVWIAVCFALQAVIARRLFAALHLQRVPQALGVLMITLTPALFSRIGTLWHPQLAAHWMILLALLMYVRNTKTLWWSGFCVYALSVHVYLFLIVFSIGFASLCKDLFLPGFSSQKLQRSMSFLVRIITVVVPVMIALFLFGFGTFLTNSSVAGVGFFRMNLLAFVNPAREEYGFLMGRLPFFTERTWITEENEGFAYLGLGVIVSVVILLAFFPMARFRLHSHHWPLVGVTAMLFGLALSERVAVGGREVVLPVPSVFIDIRQAVRAAPRFAWLSLYLLVILGWWAVAEVSRRYMNKKLALVLLVAVVTLQVVDVGPGVGKLQASVSRDKGSYAPNLGPEWSSMLDRYHSIVIVPSLDPNEDDMDYLPDEREWLADNRLFQLAWIAAFSDAKLNYAFCSRPCLNLARSATAEARTSLAGGLLEPGTIYLFSTEEEWKSTTRALNVESRRIDGFYAVLSPVPSATGP